MLMVNANILKTQGKILRGERYCYCFYSRRIHQHIAPKYGHHECEFLFLEVCGGLVGYEHGKRILDLFMCLQYVWLALFYYNKMVSMRLDEYKFDISARPL